MIAGSRHEQRVAAYERLGSCFVLGGTLLRVREPARIRAALEQIASDSRRLLDEVGADADPYLLSHVHMTIAAAQLDLAGLDDGPTRSGRVRQGLDHALESVRIGLASRTPLLSTAILPWALVVLVGGLRAAQGEERRGLCALLERCARELPRAEAQRKRAQREGARALFRSQLLHVGAQAVVDPAARAVVLRRALDRASQAQCTLLGAGDRAGATRANETVTRIRSAVGH